MEYLRKEDIVLINQMTIERHGGNFTAPLNFLNEEPLDYLIEAIEAEMFGSPLYPAVHDKAGLYMYNIISNHIFQDGNKRAGLGAALLFLKLNHYKLKEDLISHNYNALDAGSGEEYSNADVLIEFTLEVASGNIDLKECQAWFMENITKLEP